MRFRWQPGTKGTRRPAIGGKNVSPSIRFLRVAAFLAALAGHQPAGAAPPQLAESSRRVRPATPRATNDVVRTALNRTIEGVAFHRAPLVEALAVLEDRADVTFRVEWPALNGIGVYSDSLVSLTLSGLTIGDALTHVLHAADRHDGTASYAIHNGAVVVSSAAALRNLTEVRIYDCGDLFLPKPTPAQRAEIENAVADLWRTHFHVFAPPWHRAPHAGRSGARRRPDRPATSIVGPRREADEILREMADLLFERRPHRLARLIRRTIDPASWDDVPDGAGSIEVYDAALVIRQTPANHQAIETLLDGLRRAAELRNAPDPHLEIQE